MRTFFMIGLGGVICALLSIFVSLQYGPFAMSLLAVVIYGFGFMAGADTERHESNMLNLQSQIRLFAKHGGK